MRNTADFEGHVMIMESLAAIFTEGGISTKKTTEGPDAWQPVPGTGFQAWCVATCPRDRIDRPGAWQPVPGTALSGLMYSTLAKAMIQKTAQKVITNSESWSDFLIIFLLVTGAVGPKGVVLSNVFGYRPM